MFFKCKKATAAALPQKAAAFRPSTAARSGSSGFTPQSKGALIGILTFFSMFGPGRFRALAQRTLTILTMVTFVLQAIKTKRDNARN